MRAEDELERGRDRRSAPEGCVYMVPPPVPRGRKFIFSESQAPTAGATELTSTFTPGPMVDEIATRWM